MLFLCVSIASSSIIRTTTTHIQDREMVNAARSVHPTAIYSFITAISNTELHDHLYEYNRVS